MTKKNYWDVLIDDPSITRNDLFLRIRDQYAALMKHLYDDPSDIPDFRIYFSCDQMTPDEGVANGGYTVAAVSRKPNTITEMTIRDVTEIENFENSYTWYRDDVFIVFDFKAEGISPFTFISEAFMQEIFNIIISQGVRKMRMSMMSELVISTGIVEFFYAFYRIDVNFLQNLSAVTYESAYADSRIIASRTDGKGTHRTKRSGLKIAFTDPVEFSIENLRQIRKLLELSNEDLAIVIGENGRIKGLTAEAVFPNECEIRIHGHLAMTITFDGTKMISYNNGHYHIFVPHTADVNLHKFLTKIDSEITEEQAASLAQVIAEASEQAHGTILIIGSPEDIAAETDRICSAKHAIGIHKVNLAEDPLLVPSITSIDGAILVDTDCCCSCIGAILDGDFVTRGSMARGSRYNSTCNYVKRRLDFDQHFTGIVISEDGTVDAVNGERVYRININHE